MNRISVTFLGEQFSFITDQSLFSPNQLDLGSRILLESIPVPNRVINILDLGCGWGAIGIILAKLHPDSFVTLLDNNPKALFCALKNLELTRSKTQKYSKGT